MPDSMGNILFWGGAAGLILFLVIGIVCWLHLRKREKALLHAIETEYE